jgi:hypothetical protein
LAEVTSARLENFITALVSPVPSRRGVGAWNLSTDVEHQTCVSFALWKEAGEVALVNESRRLPLDAFFNATVGAENSITDGKDDVLHGVVVASEPIVNRRIFCHGKNRSTDRRGRIWLATVLSSMSPCRQS